MSAPIFSAQPCNTERPFSRNLRFGVVARYGKAGTTCLSTGKLIVSPEQVSRCCKRKSPQSACLNRGNALSSELNWKRVIAGETLVGALHQLSEAIGRFEYFSLPPSLLTGETPSCLV